MIGAYFHKKTDGSVCYRSKISYRGKSVSLGTFDTEKEASEAYLMAEFLYKHPEYAIDRLSLSRFVIEIPPENLKKLGERKSKKKRYSSLSADKVVSVLNHRDNGIYIKTPIYLRKGYISYFLKDGTELKFDTDDLFYYSSHRILNRGGSLYVNDYGLQYRIMDRYGIHSFSVAGRDYSFINGDNTDLRSSNIEILNPYFGVLRKNDNGAVTFEARIHLNGDYIVGNYKTVDQAAIAYNKAVDYARSHGMKKKFPQNFIENITASQYATVYTDIKLSERFKAFFANSNK